MLKYTHKVCVLILKHVFGSSTLLHKSQNFLVIMYIMFFRFVCSLHSEMVCSVFWLEYLNGS